ncbi:hypothetical protein GB937_003330 [Aspergillus fischeri]|nr:hypothetical protein GB937_003330 [Aspergillus fischeri]
MRLALLEEVDNVQTAGFGASFGKRRQSEISHTLAIFGIVGDQHLDQEHTHKIHRVIGGMDGNAGVSLGQNEIHSRFIQDGICGHGEDIFHGRHDASDGLFLQVKHRADDGDFIRVELFSRLTQSLVQCYQRLQTSLLVDRSMIFTQ